MTVSTDSSSLSRAEEGASKLNAEAAEFVPGSTAVATKRIPGTETIKAEILNVIRATGMTGIRVTQIPHQYRRRTGRWLIIEGTQFASLSSIIDAIMPSIEFYDSPKAPTPGMEKATTYDPDNGVVVMEPTPGIQGADTCPPLVIGDYANKVVRDKSFSLNTEDLSFFRELVVAVVRDFCDRSSHLTPSGLLTPSPGLALSLFSAEWDRYFRGALSLKGMRAKFGVMKLLPFILSCKELEMLGTHPEVRIRVKAEYTIPAQIVQQTKMSYMAAAPLTGPPMGPPIDGKGSLGESLSNYLLAAPMLAGGVSSSSAAANPLGLPLPAPVGPGDGLLPAPAPSALLSSAFKVPSALADLSLAPMEGAPGFEVPLDGSSDASASSCNSPVEQPQKVQPYDPILSAAVVKGAPLPLSKEDLKGLLSSAIRGHCAEQARGWENNEDYMAALEKSLAGSSDGSTDGDTSSSSSEDEDYDDDNTSYRKARLGVLMAGLGSKVPEAWITPKLLARVQTKRNKTVGVRVSSVRKLWKKAYPALGALDYYLDVMQVKKLRIFLAGMHEMTLLGRGSRMRVAPTAHIAQYCPRLLPPHSSPPTSASSPVPPITAQLSATQVGVLGSGFPEEQATSTPVGEGEEEIEKLIKDLLLTTDAMTRAELEMEMARAFENEPPVVAQESENVTSSSRVRE
ncbi:hypothetical protein FOL46_007271 [Perkinsus olseni]|uniref:Uncharacterized protein n=1 Tax=Perkinsus olseni TaxID=32597 RepID=A0A7J6LEV9_PEROL|nr:hypothetical protein FOL46_007271 [Perkinsus olseni]